MLTHGYASKDRHSGAYRSWRAMRSRCLCVGDAKFEDYGARGIKICKRWQSFLNFLTDMGERPKGLTLERKNTNGHYRPSNCHWANRKQQASNRRNRRLTKVQAEAIRSAKGKIMQKELAKIYGVSRSHVSMIHSGKKWI